MSAVSGDWQLWSAAAAGVGETPIWDAEAEALYWLDLFGPTLSSSATSDAPVRSWTLPSMPGCFVLAGLDDVVVALDSGIVHLDLDGGTTTMLHEAPYDSALPIQ